MANYTTKELINDSICVYNGMVTVWPQYQKEESISCFDVATFNGCYASNNGTLAFVTDDKLYVTPSTRRAYTALAGFIQKYFYVPFSNGEEIMDYPLKMRWEAIKR